MVPLTIPVTLSMFVFFKQRRLNSTCMKDVLYFQRGLCMCAHTFWPVCVCLNNHEVLRLFHFSLLNDFVAAQEQETDPASECLTPKQY